MCGRELDGVGSRGAGELDGVGSRGAGELDDVGAERLVLRAILRAVLATCVILCSAVLAYLLNFTLCGHFANINAVSPSALTLAGVGARLQQHLRERLVATCARCHQTAARVGTRLQQRMNARHMTIVSRAWPSGILTRRR